MSNFLKLKGSIVEKDGELFKVLACVKKSLPRGKCTPMLNIENVETGKAQWITGMDGIKIKDF